MNRPWLHLSFITAALAVLPARAADPHGEIPGNPANLEQLATGEIRVEANTSMRLPRGISSRASVFIPAPLEKVRELLPTWNPQPHAELDVRQFHGFAANGDPHFENLRFDARSAPVRRLLDAMKERDGLQLTKAEIAQFPATITAESAQAFWAGILRSRWQAFAATGLQPQPGQFDARSEFRTLLAEEPKVAAHFAALLATTPLALDAPGTPFRCYWTQKTINGVDGLSIGAIYRHESQFADFEFYVSSGYYVALTLHELRAVEAGGKSGTLVWQKNFASSPLLTGGFGLKRKLAAMAIESEARRSLRAFQKDASR